jgi:hypothetical protein
LEKLDNLRRLCLCRRQAQRVFRTLHFSGTAPRDDLEVFQKSKAFVQESDGFCSSGRVSQVLNDCESSLFQDFHNLLVVHATPDMVFRDVTRADHTSAERRISA